MENELAEKAAKKANETFINKLKYNMVIMRRKLQRFNSSLVKQFTFLVLITILLLFVSCCRQFVSLLKKKIHKNLLLSKLTDVQYSRIFCLICVHFFIVLCKRHQQVSPISSTDSSFLYILHAGFLGNKSLSVHFTTVCFQTY